MQLIQEISRALELLDKDRIANLNALGYIKNCKDLRVYVDNIENPEGVLIATSFWKAAYAITDSAAEQIVNFLETDKYQAIAGVLPDLAIKMQAGKSIEWENPCHIYYYPSKAEELEKPHMEVHSLKQEDAKTVDQYYSYRNEYSLHYIKECIAARPSAVIYNEEGNPVSWAIVHEDNTMGIMFTLEDYRKKGLAEAVTLDLMRKILESGEIPFVHILTDNHASQKLAEKCGMVRYKEIRWFGIEKTVR